MSDPTLKTLPGSGRKLRKVRFYSRLDMDEKSHAAWMKSKQLLSSCDDRSISMTTELTPSADGREARALSCRGQLCVPVGVTVRRNFSHTQHNRNVSNWCYFRCTELKISLINRVYGNKMSQAPTWCSWYQCQVDQVFSTKTDFLKTSFKPL